MARSAFSDVVARWGRFGALAAASACSPAPASAPVAREAPAEETTLCLADAASETGAVACRPVMARPQHALGAGCMSSLECPEASVCVVEREGAPGVCSSTRFCRGDCQRCADGLVPSRFVMDGAPGVACLPARFTGPAPTRPPPPEGVVEPSSIEHFGSHWIGDTFILRFDHDTPCRGQSVLRCEGQRGVWACRAQRVAAACGG